VVTNVDGRRVASYSQYYSAVSTEGEHDGIKTKRVEMFDDLNSAILSIGHKEPNGMMRLRSEIDGNVIEQALGRRSHHDSKLTSAE
jgi:hypothetical protein